MIFFLFVTKKRKQALEKEFQLFLMFLHFCRFQLRAHVSVALQSFNIFEFYTKVILTFAQSIYECIKEFTCMDHNGSKTFHVCKHAKNGCYLNCCDTRKSFGICIRILLFRCKLVCLFTAESIRYKVRNEIKFPRDQKTKCFRVF